MWVDIAITFGITAVWFWIAYANRMVGYRRGFADALRHPQHRRGPFKIKDEHAHRRRA